MPRKPKTERDDHDEYFQLRLTKDQLESWRAAAAADDCSLSDWVRRRCDGRPATAPKLG